MHLTISLSFYYVRKIERERPRTPMRPMVHANRHHSALVLKGRVQMEMSLEKFVFRLRRPYFRAFFFESWTDDSRPPLLLFQDSIALFISCKRCCSSACKFKCPLKYWSWQERNFAFFVCNKTSFYTKH